MTKCKFKLYEIAIHWNKVSSGYLDDLHNEISVLRIMDTDLSNPGCFACGYARHNPKKLEGKKLEHLWKNSKLERHHMHPISLGGTDEIDNIFLLCKDCHLDVPHVQMNLKEMIKWCHSRESNTMQAFNKLKESLEKMLTCQFSSEEEKMNFLNWLSKQNKENLMGKARFAIRDKKMTSNFNKLSVDTVTYMLLKDYKDQFVF